MERCVFCDWSRRTAYPSIRFFTIPKEPGMKRMRWLYAIGDKQMTNRHDRVCSVHFRGGKPSSDPSHEDFAPHLYLDKEPPPEVLHYLERLADSDTMPKSSTSEPQYKGSVAVDKPSHVEYSKVSKPNILQRKRKAGEPVEPERAPDKPVLANHGGSSFQDTPSSAAEQSKPYKVEVVKLADGSSRKMRLFALQPAWNEETNATPGMKVLFRIRRASRRIVKKVTTLESSEPETLNKNADDMVRIRMEDENGYVIEERLVTEQEARSLQQEVELQNKQDQAKSTAADSRKTTSIRPSL